MYWPDNATSAGAAPSVPAVSSASPSYFTSGVPSVTPPTVVDDWWLNTVLAELVAIATIDGAALDKANNDQCAEVLQPIRGIKGGTSDSTATSTTFKGMIAASTTSRANNATAAFVAACVFGYATGAASAAIASTGTIANSAEATGANALVAASYGASATNKASAAGDRSAVIASKATAAAVGTHADSEASAALACVEGAAGLSVNGTATAAVASKGGFVNHATAEACGLFASEDCQVGGSGIKCSAAVASGDGSYCDADHTAVLACADGSSARGTTSAAVASTDASATGARSFVGAAHDALVSGAGSAALAVGVSGDGATMTVSKRRSAMIASRRSHVGLGSDSGQGVLVASDRAELVDDNTLALGFHATTTPVFDGATNKNLTIKFDGVNGDGYFDGAADVGAADYAELFELALEGVPIPPGVLIALDEAGRAKIAAAGDDVIGVSTRAPSVLGNAAPLGWSGRYLVDEWGVPLTQTITETLEDVHVDKIEETQEDGTIKVRTIHTTTSRQVPRRVRVENPDYDASRVYVPRKQRLDQYVAVGLLGQLRVAVGEGVRPGATVAPGEGGVAKSGKATGRRVRVMRVLSPFDAARGYAIAMAFVG